MIKRVVYSLFAVIVLGIFIGCSTTSPYIHSSSVQNKIESGEWGTPYDSALLYSLTSTYDAFLQQNPEFGYKLYHAYKGGSAVLLGENGFDGGLSFLQPLPVGSELKLYSSTLDMGQYGYVTTYYGVAGVDVVLNKTGLILYNPGEPDEEKELKALKHLKSFFEGTEWGTLIDWRIKELSHE